MATEQFRRTKLKLIRRYRADQLDQNADGKLDSQELRDQNQGEQ